MQRTKTPQLVPEDVDPIWSKGAQSILSTSKGLKYRIKSIVSGMNDRLGDPRIGPMLLLGSLMSFASIWLKRSQATHQSRLDQPSQPSNMVGDGLGHLPTLVSKLLNSEKKKGVVSLSSTCPQTFTLIILRVPVLGYQANEESTYITCGVHFILLPVMSTNKMSCFFSG